VSPRLISPWRIASLAVLLGLLGSAIVTLALVDSAAPPAVGRRTGPGGQSPAVPAAGQQLGAGGQLSDVPAAGQRLVAGGTSRALPAISQASRTGLRLLREAAAACENVSYRGVQIVAWWGDGGASTSVVEVWHQPGHGTLAQAAETDPGPLSPLQAGLSGQQDPDGILGLSGQLLVLMQANYQVSYAGNGTADNRQAQIVEVRRTAGGLAARFWLDTVTKLPLRREIFDTNARVISEDAFINLTIGEQGLAGMPAASVRPWSGRLGPAELVALRGRGWPLPERLPSNLVMFASDETFARGGEIVDLSYSDGLSVVSLFVQRGALPQSLPGWRRITLSGRAVDATGPGYRSLAWSARGYVFTMIADAPPAIVADVVAALPRDQEPGFWLRLGRGFRRLVSWANPFG
jgi:sigma-E factor negative regulatory protein RseB